MLLDDAAWAELRRCYAESTDSIRALALRFGASARTIMDRAEKEGWPPRPSGAPPIGARRNEGAKRRATPSRKQPQPSRGGHTTKPAARPRPAAPGKAARRPRHEPELAPVLPLDPVLPSRPELPSRKDQKALIARLYRAISTKLEQMETRMSNGEQRSAQDEERETRALSTMIRNFEKVTEATTDFDRAKKPAAGEPTTRADAERMRREITERLERLHGGRDTKREPGGA